MKDTVYRSVRYIRFSVFWRIHGALHQDAALCLLYKNNIHDTGGHKSVRVQHQGSFHFGKRMLAEKENVKDPLK